MSVQSTCPNCGSAVVFNAENSLCVVCEACDSVVGRKDGAIENYGKSAELVVTDSPFQLGLVGEFRGVAFEITGRTQWRHSAGGVWDEWYLAFRGGAKWGWLAEAQGLYYISFEKPLSDDHRFPPFEEMVVEQAVKVPTIGAMRITEFGEAAGISAEGELPAVFRPGQTMRYADLHGPAGKFATISQEPGEPLEFFVGKRVSLEEIGLAHALSREEELAEVSSAAVNCPQCGGALQLCAPGAAERVTCPNCDSLLDVNDGSLEFLYKLGEVPVTPTIPLGTKGTLRGREYTVIGFLERYVTYNRQVYKWEEFLLYTPRQPFRWLMQSQYHWSLGEGVSSGEVRATGSSRGASYKGKHFRLFDASVPKVSVVLGEFYWKVNVGEQVRSRDYVRPPLMLSREESVTEAEQFAPVQLVGAPDLGPRQPIAPPAAEVNYTLAEYIPREEIEKAFGIRTKAPHGIAPNQPYPYPRLSFLAGMLLLMVVVIGVLVAVSAPQAKVLEQSFVVPAAGSGPVLESPLNPAVGSVATTATGQSKSSHVSQDFTLKSMRNVAITVRRSDQGKWVYLEGFLYHKDRNQRTPFATGLSVEERSETEYISAPSAGVYNLNFDVTKQDSSTPQTVTIVVKQGVPRFGWWCLATWLLLLLFVATLLGKTMFEKRRWSESDYA